MKKIILLVIICLFIQPRICLGQKLKTKKELNSVQLENKVLRAQVDSLNRELAALQKEIQRLQFGIEKKYYTTQKAKNDCEEWNICRVWAEQQYACSSTFKIISTNIYSHWYDVGPWRQYLEVKYLYEGKTFIKKYQRSKRGQADPWGFEKEIK